MRILNICFIVIFLLMVTLPLVFIDLSKDRASVRENRMLANPPVLSDIKNHPGYFIHQFDKWFKDSTGFREQIIAIYNITSKNTMLNGIMYRNGKTIYLVGEQGHHYYGREDGILIPKFQGKQFVSDEKLQIIATKLEEIKTYLNKKGIPLVVMFCTDKETIYPEFYPRIIKRGPDPIQLDVITTYLQEHTSVDVFNIRQALLAEKDNYLLYDRSTGDHHYNEVGGFFAYRELMKHINPYFPQMVPFELDDIEISYDQIGIAHVSLKADKMYKKLPESFFDDVNVKRPFAWENIAFENTDPNLPVIFFLRDSDAGFNEKEFFQRYIPQHFGKAIFIHFLNAKNFEEYINKYKPDIVVIEALEAILDGFHNFIGDVPELP